MLDTTKWTDAYLDAIAAESLMEKGHVSFVDVDDSLYVRRRGAELAPVAAEARYLCEQAGAAGLVSARRDSMMVTSKDLIALRSAGVNLEDPRCVLGPDGKYYFWPLDDLAHFRDVVGWQMVLSYGSHSLVRQRDGVYVPDLEYAAKLGVTWRSETMAHCVLAVQREHPELHVLSGLVDVEFEENFRHGYADVPPLPHRIQWKRRGRDALSQYEKITHLLAEKAVAYWGKSPNLEIVDESEPEEHIYSFHLTPLHGTKVGVVDNALHGLRRATGLSFKEKRATVIGNAPTDLLAGVYAGYDKTASTPSEAEEVQVTFLLVGKAAVAPYLAGNKKGQLFCGKSLEWAWRRFEETSTPGVFRMRADENRRYRRVVIGDITFPGTEGPETIVEYFKSGMHEHAW